MAEVEQSAKGSGTAQAELWGERARDWADVMEGWNGWGVARPGASVAMSVFGRPEHCQSTAMFKTIAGLLPAKPAEEDKNAGPALHEEGALEALATQAGLTPAEGGYIEFVESYPNVETMLRGVMAAPPMVRAARAVGHDAVREALAETFRAFETRTGSYALEEEVRCLIAKA